ncbi:Ldh family oxidoreductase [Paenibacillus nasutitermitis]|uniref:Oxidoreductase YjmC n=1 Tax=Paenibacillus nasutitermitis TaxID=1652958 RepID=A0A917DQR1_9BACL|nr:Ldh family oxidoreductase [Paenibacillus nasutitermitis]GGD60084.1 putative oxidoreductase YjmC [Paenibacillus nasutitermitis]
MEHLIAAAELRNRVISKLIALHIPLDHAEIVADVLVHANLRGVDSHGVMRLPHYVSTIQSNGIHPNPAISFSRTGTVSGIVDGNDGLGHVIMHRAAQEAIQLAKEHGMGAVSSINSSHCGALSYFAQMAIDHGMVSIVVTNTDKMVAPFGGTEAFFGTNPIAFGFPAATNPPIILDMATSSVAYGKILDARQKNMAIPDHWGIDANGQATNDPHLITTLLPFGGAKGYGINLVVDILAGVLTGSPFGPHIAPMYGDDLSIQRKLGHFMLVMDPGKFSLQSHFGSYLDQLIDELHQAPASQENGKVMLPGEIESICEKKRLQGGIPLDTGLYHYLMSSAL